MSINEAPGRSSGDLDIYDLAREVGVSYGTVSRALNDRPGVSAETKARVLETARRLGYVPSPLARAFATRSTAAIGIIVPGMHDPFFTPIVHGIQSAVRELGHGVMLSDVGRSPEQGLESASAFVQLRVAGIVVLGGTGRLDGELAELVRSTPTVIAVRKAKQRVLPSVSVDHARGARLVTEHLVATGRRRIGFVALDDRSVAARDRLHGYRQALRKTGIAPDPDLVFRAGGTVADGTATTAAILRGPQRRRRDALLFASDAMALGGMRALCDAGVAVPDDIAVAGYGDIAFAEVFSPSLTTVRVPTDLIGTTAGRMLASLIANRDLRPQDIDLDVSLVVRESTAT